MNYIVDQTIKNKDFSTEMPAKTEYENCTFLNCVFAESNLSDFAFQECRFEDCDLSNAVIGGVAFRSVTFKNCKLLGLHFDECNPFLLEFTFDNCLLNLASFYQLKIKKTHFQNCILQETDFAETDLTASVFHNCDLSGAMFSNTILDKADFRTSSNYSIDPENNRIKKAKFSVPAVTGLLHKYDIVIEGSPL